MLRKQRSAVVNWREYAVVLRMCRERLWLWNRRPRVRRDDRLPHAVQHRSRKAPAAIRPEADFDAGAQEGRDGRGHEAPADGHVGYGAVGDSAPQVSEAVRFALGHEGAVREDGAGGQEVEGGVEVGFRGEGGEEGAREGDLLLCFVEVRLDGEGWVGGGEFAEAGEELGRAADGEPGG